MLPSMTGHLVGLSEIASMLGVTRQRASQLVRDYDDFPPPVAELAAGRVWETAAVEVWAKAHPDRPPGRRVKEPGRGS
jgi:predicted DNA-binding transcriptional regulator AlpA